ncbi:MAG: hypothetical protein LBM78_01290, partial [Clostridiales bacterium]|nr:hypothetical protein [Clostridiales bacterium]
TLPGSDEKNTVTFVFGRTVPDLHIDGNPGYEYALYTDAALTRKFNYEVQPAAKAVTLYAKVTPIVYYIRYENLQGGVSPNPSAFTIENATIFLADPIRPGYTGWWSMSAIPHGSTGDKTITAEWTPIVYSVRYENLQGGVHGNIYVETYTIESETVTLTPPTGRDGYTGAWDKGTLEKGSYGDKTFTAVWTPIAYPIVYENLQDGQNPNPATYTVESGPLTLAPASRHGYTGVWDVSTIPSGSMGSVTVTAAWSPVIYHITYVGLSGTDNPNGVIAYTIESETIVFAVPADVAGYKCVWDVPQIAAGSYGDVTVTAQWTAKTYTVTLDRMGGTDGEGSVTATFGEALPAANAPIKPGYTFIGYFDGNTGLRYYDNCMSWVRVWELDADTTLQARYMLPFSGGGTADAPYSIATRDRFYLFASLTRAKTEGVYFTLDASIDLCGEEWTPIAAFYGFLDGKGHAVKGFKITNAAILTSAGLFAANYGTIKSLGVEDFVVDVGFGSGPAGSAGGIVGDNCLGGLLQNCYAAGGSVSGVFYTGVGYSSGLTVRIGGLVGYNEGQIASCYAAVTVGNTVQPMNFNVWAGGLAGFGGQIESCYATGDVFAFCGTHEYTSAHAGGLVGAGVFGVKNSFAAGNVTATIVSPAGNHSANAGGLAGDGYFVGGAGQYGAEEQVITRSAMSGGPNAGTNTCPTVPRASLQSQAWVTENLWTVESEMWTFEAGRYPVLNYARINEGAEIATEAQLRALQGKPLALDYKLTADITLSAAWTPIADLTKGATFDGNGKTIGGLTFAEIEGSTGLFARNHGVIKNLGLVNLNVGPEAAVGFGSIGGLVGINDGSLRGCYAAGQINLLSHEGAIATLAGGLVGENNGQISACFAAVAMDVSTNIYFSWCYVGGLVGCNNPSGTLSDVFATGSVYARTGKGNSDATAGGLVGRNGGGTVTNAYATGAVAAVAASMDARASAGGVAGTTWGKLVGCVAVGNVSVTMAGYDDAAVGAVAWREPAGSLVNCYRYEGQVFFAETIIGASTAATDVGGIACTAAQLGSAVFFTDTLGWSASVWNFDALDFSAQTLPALKG